MKYGIVIVSVEFGTHEIQSVAVARISDAVPLSGTSCDSKTKGRVGSDTLQPPSFIYQPETSCMAVALERIECWSVTSRTKPESSNWYKISRCLHRLNYHLLLFGFIFAAMCCARTQHRPYFISCKLISLLKFYSASHQFKF